MLARVMDIGGRRVGEGQPCFIIAEAGSNHNNDYALAQRLVDAAATAGADAVKFQFFEAGKIAADTSHPVATLENGTTLYQLYKAHETPHSWIPRLQRYCAEHKILFLATPFDEHAADLLEANGAPAYKVASFEIVHTPLIRHLARFGKPLIISSGMADIEDIKDAIDAATSEGNAQLAILHCGISYPEPFSEVNLRAMDTIRERFGCLVGYSDHTLGTTVPVAAVARGASVIEKHFTLSRAMQGPDHAFALEPHELAAMVRAIRDCEAALGSGTKHRTASEEIHYRRGRRSIFAARDIAVGDRIQASDLAILRPALGLMPKHIDSLIGKVAQKPLRRNDPIGWDLIGGEPPRSER